MMIYFFEATQSGSIIDVYKDVTPKEIEEFSYQVEREGNSAFAVSDTYVQHLVNKVLERYAKRSKRGFYNIDPVYEDTLINFLGERDWQILKYTEKMLFVAKIKGRKLYVL